VKRVRDVAAWTLELAHRGERDDDVPRPSGEGVPVIDLGTDENGRRVWAPLSGRTYRGNWPPR
jgi:hypothetical protein